MLNLLKINFLKNFWEVKNNKLKIVLGIIVNVVLIMYVYFQFLQVDLDNLYANYTTVVLALCVLWFITNSFTFTSSVIIQEARIGTIDQLITSPYGIRTIVLIRLFIQTFQISVYPLIIIFCLNVIMESMIPVDLLSYVCIVFVGLFSLYGIGLAMASVSILSKEADLFAILVKLSFFYFIFKFDENLFIPFSYAKAMLVRLVTENNTITTYSAGYLSLFLINSLVYFVIGMICFHYVEKLALKKGNLKGY